MMLRSLRSLRLLLPFPREIKSDRFCTDLCPMFFLPSSPTDHARQRDVDAGRHAQQHDAGVQVGRAAGRRAHGLVPAAQPHRRADPGHPRPHVPHGGRQAPDDGLVRAAERAERHADGHAPRRAPDAVLRRPARVGEDPREDGGRGQGQPAAQEEDLRVGARHRRALPPQQPGGRVRAEALLLRGGQQDRVRQGQEAARARPLQAARDGRRADLARRAELLRIAGPAHHGGLRHERVQRPADAVPAGLLPRGLHGPGHQQLRAQDRARRGPRQAGRGRDLLPRAARHDGVPAQRGEDARGDRRRGVDALGRRGAHRRRRAGVHHGPHQGAHHHGGRREHRAGAGGGRASGTARRCPTWSWWATSASTTCAS